MDKNSMIDKMCFCCLHMCNVLINTIKNAEKFANFFSGRIENNEYTIRI